MVGPSKAHDPGLPLHPKSGPGSLCFWVETEASRLNPCLTHQLSFLTTLANYRNFSNIYCCFFQNIFSECYQNIRYPKFDLNFIILTGDGWIHQDLFSHSNKFYFYKIQNKLRSVGHVRSSSVTQHHYGIVKMTGTEEMKMEFCSPNRREQEQIPHEIVSSWSSDMSQHGPPEAFSHPGSCPSIFPALIKGSKSSSPSSSSSSASPLIS